MLSSSKIESQEKYELYINIKASPDDNLTSHQSIIAAHWSILSDQPVCGIDILWPNWLRFMAELTFLLWPNWSCGRI